MLSWRLTRAGITNGVSRYPTQASLALAVVGVVALAAFTRRRLPASTAVLSAVWLGVESVVYPGLIGSIGNDGERYLLNGRCGLPRARRRRTIRLSHALEPDVVVAHVVVEGQMGPAPRLTWWLLFRSHPYRAGGVLVGTLPGRGSCRQL